MLNRNRASIVFAALMVDMLVAAPNFSSIHASFPIPFRQGSTVSLMSSKELPNANVLTDTPWGDWSHYHNLTEIVNTLTFLNSTYPGVVDVFSIGKSWQNRSIYCVRLTNESLTAPKSEVFFAGYHHAREPITAELALYFTVYVATGFDANATITRLLNGTEIYIVVAMNVDGFDLFEANDWQRKNSRATDEDSDGLVDEDPPEDSDADGFVEELYNLTNPQYPTFIRWEGSDNDGDGRYGEDWIGGVDLNRNYAFQWGSGSSDPSSEIYKGPTPFSEPETRAIRDFVLAHNFTYAISFHSGTELILYPWGHTYTPPEDEAEFLEIARNLSALTGNTLYGQSSELYFSYGSWDDWMYGVRNILAFTCEIFYNSTWGGIAHPGPYPNTWWEGGLKYWFNPFPSGIQSTIMRWLPVFFEIAGRPTADVAITQIKPDRTSVSNGYSLRLDVNVHNSGPVSEIFNVTVYANSTLAQRQSIHLAGESSSIITFVWSVLAFPEYQNCMLRAYADTVPGEISTVDNQFSDGFVAIVHEGDVTADAKVDIKDLARVSAAFGSLRVNDPLNARYAEYWHSTPCIGCPHTPNTDINGDRKIDIQDVARTSANFGWHQPA